MSSSLYLLGAGVLGALALSKRQSTPAGSPSTAAASAPVPTPPTGDAWTQYDTSFQAVASFYPYPWQWLKAIALNETLLGTDATYLSLGKGSSDGKSWGIMQLTIPTASDQAGVAVTPDELLDDHTSIELAGKYVNWLYERYAGDPQKTIMSYNQGPGNTDAGQTYAADYFSRWQRWLDKVNSGAEFSL